MTLKVWVKQRGGFCTPKNYCLPIFPFWQIICPQVKLCGFAQELNIGNVDINLTNPT